MAVVASFLFLIMATTGQGIAYTAAVQTMVDNATNGTKVAADNMTADAGNMTDANTTQIGNISGCGNECF